MLRELSLFELSGDSLGDSTLTALIDPVRSSPSVNSLSSGALVENNHKQLFNIATTWDEQTLEANIKLIIKLKGESSGFRYL